MGNKTSTYQGRLALTSVQETFLSGYATHYNHVERMLYADMQRTGDKAASFKNSYLIRFGITARQFNAISRNLEGKIASVLELLSLRKQEFLTQITRAKTVLSKIKNPDKKHQKSRRLNILETRLVAINQQIANQEPRICFGSRSLFRKQFHLEINGYKDHQQWKQDWDAKRNSQFYVLGSKDETAGCNGCAISANLDGTFNLRLRSMSKEAHHVLIENVSIPYGQDVIREAMRTPQALSYRFLLDAKGWKIFVTTNLPEIKTISAKASGTIGIDINADCLAVSETDRFGNMIGSKIIPLVTYGKSADQAEAIIGDAVKKVVALAVAAKKPIVIEDLDFSKKKSALENENPKHARMISSFSYNKIVQNIKTRAYKSGIEILEVNPAYTSVIGLVNFSKKFGISVHQAAAFAIARRGSGFRERPTMGKDATVPTPKGDHVTFPLPARNRGKHVWSFWSNVRKIHKAVLAAHFRPPQGDPLKQKPSKRKVPIFTVEPRNANRQQHCSAGVMEDIPW